MNHKFLLFSSLLLFFSLTVDIFTSSINSSLSFFFYKKIGDNDDDNYSSSSYFYYHLAYAADASPGGKSFNVTIPKGSANPEVDITKLGPRQWYFPRQVTIHTNDTIRWINQDTEAHTVTSGVGAGIESLINNKRGTPNGIFDSGLFKTGESWTHTFTNPGTYTYFCTIHPWMEGVVSVQGVQALNIPNYPVDASGERISKLPVYHFTSDGKIEVGLSWDPVVLLTGKEISFFINFFDLANNKPNLLPFDFILMQNGKQLERIPSISQVGMNLQHYVFSNSGPTTIRIENVGGAKTSFAAFNTTVYDNPSISSAAANQLAAQYKGANNPSNPFKVNPITLVYIAYAVIFGIPAAVAVVYFLYRKGAI
jgi:plastocyanin